MRIALLSYSTKPRGGVVHTLALAEALAELGQDVTVITLGRGEDTTFYREVDPRVEVRIVPFPGVETESVGDRIIRSIEVLRGGVDAREFDVVHAEDCISANAVEGAIRTVHHLDEFTTPELVCCHDRAIREPVSLVCVSAAVAAQVRAGYEREATVIPNGVDSASFEAAASGAPAAADARAAWQRRFGRYVLSVGGIEPRKGTIDLLEAYACVRDGDPELRLVIAGGETLFDYSEYRAEFDARAAALGVRVDTLGTVPQPELPALVAGAAVVGFVSTKEGFGLAAMEALAAGVPVIARDLPVLREVYRDTVRYAVDVPGIATALDDALTESDVADAAARVSRGRQLARSYTWAAAAQAHLALYRRVLQATPSARPLVTEARPGR